MANTKSAKKRIQVTAKKTMRNKMIKSRTKTAIKKAATAIGNINQVGSQTARAELAKAVSTIDRARTKGIMHRNTAARRKSRLAKMMNKVAG